MSVIQAALITAIIPVRLSKDKLYDEVERIERIIATVPQSYAVLIVDYGTPEERRRELNAVAERTGVKLVREDTGRAPFSVGHARDIGTQHATTPLVIYHDIDFLLSREGYDRVVAEARLRGMPENAYAFFALPGAYLTEDFTQKYLAMHSSGDGAFGDMLVHDGVMRHDKAVFESNTFAISAIVASKYHLLALGGHDKSFTGHGAEDFELMHRLTSYYHRGPRPKDYYNNTKNNSIQTYVGFRAYYALYGIDVFQRGTVIAHLWHPRRRDAGYVGTDNQVRVSQAMRDYDRGVSSIKPLEDALSNEFTLVLVEPGTSPARALRHVFPALGKFRCIPDKTFGGADSLISMVRSEGFTRVFFLNPYGNEHRLQLYKGVKEAGIRFIAYDRGALTDSWFFDTKGFLGESGSYARAEWDHPLNDEDRQKTIDWLDHLRLNNDTLEKNGARVGPEQLRERLHIGDRKVLFVALQRPSDTATVYFAGPCGHAYTFNSWISDLADNIDPTRYAIVVKKHPLETQRPSIEGAIFAPDDAHIKDLIELADKVLLINSGTGLIAAALGKPVICCGAAFYDHEGITFNASSVEELLRLAQEDLETSEETRLRFIKYLVFDFYSFGKAEYIEKVEADGSMRRIARKTVYSSIRGLTSGPILLGESPQGVSLDAPLFYSYGGRKAINGNNDAKPKASAEAGPVRSASPRKVSFIRRPLVPIVRPFIRVLGTSKDVEKYNRDPVGFFQDLRNPIYKRVGRVFFPVKPA
ncbi:capsular biosynthesis protein [Sinorhizobium medicae]|nr:capsular biosynthesis protein [Sinorhizobium medicae]